MISRRQTIVLIALTLIVGLARLLAMARAPFDWDEALFALGVRDYDVTQHRPHPPGYPLFILAAKFVHLFGLSEFRSLQVVVLVGGFMLFPALVALARELGFDFSTAVCGAAIYCFLPNVWVYGGTGFSDVPATAIGFVACWLLLRGRRDVRSYVFGAIVLGIAAGIRPPNLLIGAIPALVATYHRVRVSIAPVVTAILLGAAITGGSYLGAALQSPSIEAYARAVETQSKYVREIDSFRNPGRPPLSEAAEIFLLWPVRQKQQMVGLAALAVISLIHALIRRRKAPWFVLAVFGPYALVAWLNLDFATAARYAIAYMAAHALLAADGLGVIVRRREGIQALLSSAVIAVFAVWTWPALELQRTTDPPPVAALEWIRQNVPPDAKLYIHGGIGPTAEVLLPDRKKTYYDTPEQISVLSGQGWVVDLRGQPDGHDFIWPRNSLWKIVRARNFEASVARVASTVGFGSGFYGEEVEGAAFYRWMGRDGQATLPALPGKGKLYLKMYVPIDTIAPPSIEVSLNGRLLERFKGSTAFIEKSWIAPSRPGGANELRIATSATAREPGGTRDLGLRIEALSWTPAP
jgi:hypothetical protein